MDLASLSLFANASLACQITGSGHSNGSFPEASIVELESTPFLQAQLSLGDLSDLWDCDSPTSSNSNNCFAPAVSSCSAQQLQQHVAPAHAAVNQAAVSNNGPRLDRAAAAAGAALVPALELLPAARTVLSAVNSSNSSQLQHPGLPLVSYQSGSISKQPLLLRQIQRQQQQRQQQLRLPELGSVGSQPDVAPANIQNQQTAPQRQQQQMSLLQLKKQQRQHQYTAVATQPSCPSAADSVVKKTNPVAAAKKATKTSKRKAPRVAPAATLVGVVEATAGGPALGSKDNIVAVITTDLLLNPSQDVVKLAGFLQGSFSATSSFDLQEATSLVTRMSDEELLMLAATAATASIPASLGS